MLVSSIGYFDPLKTVNRDYIVNNQTAKINLSEGFGHFNEIKIQEKNNFFERLIVNLNALFSKDKSDIGSKSLSLIA